MKRTRTKWVILAVFAAVIIAGAALAMILFLPRKLVGLANIGKLENVYSIVYQSSACCGYNEGADFETTITDAAAIERIVDAFNTAKMKMKWRFLNIHIGGANYTITFRTSSGYKSLQLDRGQLGNYDFVSEENALSVIRAEISRPSSIRLDRVLQATPTQPLLMIDTYEDFLTYAETFESPQDVTNRIEDYRFKQNRLFVVNLGMADRPDRFFLTKITQKDGGAYTLRLENVASDGVTPDAKNYVGLLFVPKELDVAKLTINALCMSAA